MTKYRGTNNWYGSILCWVIVWADMIGYWTNHRPSQPPTKPQRLLQLLHIFSYHTAVVVWQAGCVCFVFHWSRCRPDRFLTSVCRLEESSHVVANGDNLNLRAEFHSHTQTNGWRTVPFTASSSWCWLFFQPPTKVGLSPPSLSVTSIGHPTLDFKIFCFVLEQGREDKTYPWPRHKQKKRKTL